MKKYLVLSGKGGVGKTTVAVNLAYLFAEQGRAGILDVDIHGPNVPKMLGLPSTPPRSEDNMIIPIQTEQGLKVISMAFLLESEGTSVIWRGPMKHKVIQQFIEQVDWGDLDSMVVDFPPGTGDECISIAQLMQDITGAVIVSSPQEVALLDTRKSIDFCRKFEIEVAGLIENMAGEIFGSGSVEKMASEYDVPFLGRLPLDKAVAMAGDNGRPFVSGDSPAAVEFRTIFNKLIS